MTHVHQAVLLKEAIDSLLIHPGGTYIDLTFGRGGHSQEILKGLGDQGRLIAVDKDVTAVEQGKKKPFCDSRFSIYHQSFARLDMLIDKLKLQGRVDGILLDLGVSSPQLDDPERGFSFAREGPLDMRMNVEQDMDAATWLSQSKKNDIIRVLREYGEERYARRIATMIVEQREKQPLATTKQLADLIVRALPTQDRKKHPATRSFQALRIAVNNELEELSQCLEQCLKALIVGGRLVVISFHSLEDRIVKRFFHKHAKGDLPPKLPILESQIHRCLKIIGSLIRPTDKEVKQNIRARSARLRVAEKILMEGLS